jgi:hypothetical protein
MMAEAAAVAHKVPLFPWSVAFDAKRFGVTADSAALQTAILCSSML